MERLELERIEREKWNQLEAKDLERRNEELEELSLLERCFPEAEKLKQDTRLLSQWKHYIQCDGSPDPSIAPEINTFISLWKEETNETFEEVIAKSKLVLNLIEKLKLILLETPPYYLEDKNIIQYQGSILEMQELLHLKFNIATEILLRQASTLADLDSGNMEKVIQDENVTLYVWANLKKNPRYKSVRFSETQTGFEIPRILATSDIALRLLHTHYDHVTPLRPISTSFQGHTTRIPQFVRDEVKSVEAAISKELPEESKQLENESNSIHEEEETKCEEQGDIEVQTSFVQEESDAPKCELVMKLLSETVLSAQLLLIENATEKPTFFEDNEVDLYQFTTLGGVYHLDILELPPQYKTMKSWMIVEENLCMLASIKLSDKKHSSTLEGKWMTPISFIFALKETGLNIFPSGHSHFYVIINYKDPLVELKAYRQLALLSSAFAFGWSKWNVVCTSKKVIVKLSEYLTEEPIQNPNWTLLMFSGNRAQRLKINENSETFSEALKEETEFHSTLYHMVKDFASKEAMEKIKSSNCQFIDSVCYMLLSTRLLSYS
ncbi:dynein intermediate chain CFAP94, axonemal isoform X1 [Vulpes lagopus]|uniref:dynein intermediate chain CFAP94, axonemal isoform X1 n=1 Tax=Vulpes lagopus TaxID=494514 RepID=UPI001BC9BD26|nr:dynein intermediate chain CFAP94, axonemal isoform X1 [Vulpes lagopus]